MYPCDAYRIHGLPWAFKRLLPFSISWRGRSDQSGTTPRAAPVGQNPINFWMTSSIVSRGAKRLLGMTRWAGRSAFSSFALGFVCLAIFSPNRRPSLAGGAAEPEKRPK